jgi:hypothetical protein
VLSPGPVTVQRAQGKRLMPGGSMAGERGRAAAEEATRPLGAAEARADRLYQGEEAAAGVTGRRQGAAAAWAVLEAGLWAVMAEAGSPHQREQMWRLGCAVAFAV